MKHLFAAFLFLSGTALFSQTYPSHNISLISRISPDTTPISPTGKRYSGCWGWHQAAKNREYAIAGSKTGTYFIDITNPASPVVADFVPGKLSDWREMKTYQNYCYVVSDVETPNRFQIIDMQYLPDSVHVVHDANTLFELGHTIWIDQDKMYVAQTGFVNSIVSPMTVWSLATPTAPVLLRRIEQDQAIPEIHDMFVRNDTVYASAAWQGISVLKLNANNTFSPLGSYDGYSQEGYNHSSALTQDGKYLLFCDEVPESIPMHLIDVQNLQNIQPVKAWLPHEKTTPHNPFIIGNKWAIVSCYQDGLFIYDISQPPVIGVAGFFDTFPQGGVNTGEYIGGAYNGNWGAHPFLPSGLIIANDMQNGVFILDASDAYATTGGNAVGLADHQTSGPAFSIYPNPAGDQLRIQNRSEGKVHFEIKNILGNTILSGERNGAFGENINISQFPNGTYFMTLSGEQGALTKKFIINH